MTKPMRLIATWTEPDIHLAIDCEVQSNAKFETQEDGSLSVNLELERCKNLKLIVPTDYRGEDAMTLVKTTKPNMLTLEPYTPEDGR